MLEGCFVNEKKNRFLCEVLIDGTLHECYIPSSCHLSHFVDLPGKTVVLKENKFPTSRTKYTVFGVKNGKEIVPLQLTISNQVILHSLNSQQFSFLGAREHVEKEKIIDGYKCDLFIKDTKTIMEIKSIIDFSETAVFPSVYSERANNQLQALSRLLTCGYKVCYMFVSLSSSVQSICLNKTMTDFINPFYDCLEKGMLIKAYSVKMVDDGVLLHKEIGLIKNEKKGGQ